MKAISNRDIKKTKEYLKKNADPHSRIDFDKYYTPWNWAFSCQCFSIILELLEHNANPNYPIEELMGMTIIFGAIMYEDEGIIQLLVNHNADLNVLDDNGWTPLYFAVSQSKKCVELVPLLLELGVDITIGKEKIQDLEKEDSQNLELFYQYILQFLVKLEEKRDFELLKVHKDRILDLENSGYNLTTELSEKIKALSQLHELENQDESGSFDEEKALKELHALESVISIKKYDDKSDQRNVEISLQTKVSDDFVDFLVKRAPRSIFDKFMKILKEVDYVVEKKPEKEIYHMSQLINPYLMMEIPGIEDSLQFQNERLKQFLEKDLEQVKEQMKVNLKSRESYFMKQEIPLVEDTNLKPLNENKGSHEDISDIDIQKKWNEIIEKITDIRKGADDTKGFNYEERQKHISDNCRLQVLLISEEEDDSNICQCGESHRKRFELFEGIKIVS